MASETITLTATCDGGNHMTLTGTGAKAVTVQLSLEDALGPVSNDDAMAFIKVLIKLGKVGRTNAQLKTLFQSGVTVSV